MKKLFISFVFGLIFLDTLCVVESIDCNEGWVSSFGSCWYFSLSDNANLLLSFTEAESWCQSHTGSGHLASFKNSQEETWAYTTQTSRYDKTLWWIGLNDLAQEGVWEWIDPAYKYDPEEADNFQIDEPNNVEIEQCVESQVRNPVIRGQWRDRSCHYENYFICRAPPGEMPSCDEGWLRDGQSCYKAFNEEVEWYAASGKCKTLGGDLASISTQTEESFLETLVMGYLSNFWIGLSDTASPGSLAWSDKTTAYGYEHFASGFPESSLPYYGSTCVDIDYKLQLYWSTTKCSTEMGYICERGLRGQCPNNEWTYLNGMCYEFVVNPTRAMTWSSAKEFCKAMGAGLLKIETDDQQKYLSAAMEQYYSDGAREIWLGGSDIGHDEKYTWWDGTSILLDYWDDSMPGTDVGREGCMNLYTGKTSNNWERSTCFYERQFICEIDEGKSLATVPVVTVEGKCDEGWRHFNGKCYLFTSATTSKTSAANTCVSNGGQLASILSANELSFVTGHLSNTESWIGLACNGGICTWDDGSPFAFQNWHQDFTSDHGTGCVTCDPNGLWSTRTCSIGYGNICKKNEIPTAPSTLAPPTVGTGEEYEKCGGDGWFSDPQSEKCYKVNFEQTRTWNDARYKCQSDGGDLAAINTPAEQEFVQAVIKELPTVTNIWIGASDRLAFQEGASDIIDQGWSWSDGSPFNFLNWDDGQPDNDENEDCSEIYTVNGKWNDMTCLYYRHFMCEKFGSGSTITGDMTDSDCRSSDACCFNHLGVEYGGKVPDSALSSSSIRNEYYNTTRGRLNTPENVLILSTGPIGPGTIGIGSNVGGGHGAWKPSSEDIKTSYFQVDFDLPTEVKGIITQGRNGYIVPDEREWTTTFKISFSQDPINKLDNVKDWEELRDGDGQVIMFDGNFDQNTQITNLFPTPLILFHIRCHIVEYHDDAAIRLEYIGCKASCLYQLGMNSGGISDSALSASSGDAKQARPPAQQFECLSSSSDNGASYRGWISQTETGIDCQPWSSSSPHPHSENFINNPEDGLNSNYCRNPGGSKSRPWCYTIDSSVQWEYCNVPVCPTYTPTGWSPSSSSTSQYVQVQFSDYYRISGVTVYSDASGNFVTKYYLKFSETGSTFTTYTKQDGTNKLFNGPLQKNSEYLDILHEPISTRNIQINPQAWNGQIRLQFEINGCYVDRRLTCYDKASLIDEETFAIDCPPGCVEDLNKGEVYGTDTYTESSAVCPAAIHAGRIKNNIGGYVQVDKRNGANQYLGSSRHGITSLSFSASYQSITFGGNVLRCDGDWQPWQDHCYYLSKPNMYKSWHNARADCQSMGADLVSITSKAENDFVYLRTLQDLSIDVSINYFWLGFNDLDYQNYYLWSDGTPVVKTFWWLKEPTAGYERCVSMFRTCGFWNDNSCDHEYPYLCKKSKQLLPPVTTILPPTDEGCGLGWTAYGASCYYVSSDEMIYQYADHMCSEMGSNMVAIGDNAEQAFVHAFVTSKLTPGLDYKSWIGLTVQMDEFGGEYFRWENGEPLDFALWDINQPDLPLQCAFPFEYNGIMYYECTTVDSQIVGLFTDQPWCSPTPIFTGAFIPCGSEFNQGCAYMDDLSGLWSLDYCNIKNLYYTCEKARDGYVQPVYTTPSTEGKCTAAGWTSTDQLVNCYQINEFTNRTERHTWNHALEYCRAQGADLISIHSSQEEIELANLIIQYGVNTGEKFWLGLSDFSNDAGYLWSDGSAVNYANWASGEPNNHNGNENCVESYLTTSGQWNDATCDTVRNWICMIGKRQTPLPPPTFPPPQGQENTNCGVGWIKYTTDYGVEKCYYFEDTDWKGWSSAESKCIEYGGHLVAIHSLDENTFLIGRTSVSKGSNFWIGLKSGMDRVFSWADSSALDYINWSPYEPNNYLETEDCAEYYVDNGLWNDNNCGIQFPYICEKCTSCSGVQVQPTPPVTGNCPSGYKAYGNKCFFVSDISLPWWDAREYCTNNSAELVTITNANEQAFLVSYVFGKASVTWIGLTDRYGSVYSWGDQTDVSYTNWDGGQPDNYNDAESCAEMKMDSTNAGKWNDQNCDNYKQFICYTFRDDSLDIPDPTNSPNKCPNGYYSWNYECYLLINEAKTFEDAQSYCNSQSKYTDLVSVEHIYENEFLHSIFWRTLQTGQKIWLGMTFTEEQIPSDNIHPDTSIDYPNTGLTTNVSFTWTDGWPIYYTNWAESEPNQDHMDTGSGCVYMNNDGTWSTAPSIGTNVASCVTPMAFICKYNKQPIPTNPPAFEGNCDPGFEGFENYCYYVQVGLSSSTVRSWSEAADECHFRDAELVSFHSEMEVKFVIATIPGGQSHNLWIGLDHDGNSGWKWRDNSPVDFFYWGGNEPNGQADEECVELYPWNGQWNDLDCYERRGFICKKPKDSTICNVAATFQFECGYPGIDETYCVARKGCCWDGTLTNDNFTGCFYGEGIGPSGIPLPPGGDVGLSGGAIFGIVVASLVAAAAACAVIYYCFIVREGKSMTDVGLPTMPDLPKMSIPTFGGSSSPPKEVPAGFDNPMAGDGMQLES